MIKNENEPRLISLKLAFGLGEKDISPTLLKSIISLHPNVCDVETTDVPPYCFTVEQTVQEVLQKCEDAGYPFFKSAKNIGAIKKISDLPSYRKINFE